MTQNHEVNKITLANTMIPSGGNYDTYSRVTAMTLAFNFREFFTANFARFLWATVNDLPSEPVTGEVVTVGVNMVSMLSKMPLSITAVVDAETGLVEYDEDIDFRLTGSGIEPLPGGALATAIAAAEAADEEYQLEVDYVSAPIDDIQPLAGSQVELEILFEGVNAVGTQKRTNNLYYICKFDLVAALSWINVEDFMGMEVTCEVLGDTSRSGVGVSPYMKIMKEKPLPA
ncbi:hypothetical protein [Ectopseudomonas alcaliphila]|nr:hypothetical protein [Pseudomonas alcaliphila]MDX5994945.1 hypothetical protein [Pseudomonas alcaliphila]